jgi:hypothetical protein
VTHYQVLGVARGASDAEIRQAYLRLAHLHHPDHHLGSGDAARTASEQRMREINAAWGVLSDPNRRRGYDESLDLSPRAAVVEPEAERTWRPFDDGWEVGPDDLDPRLDDSSARRPTGARLLALAPVVLLVAGVGGLIVGGVAGLRGVVAVGFIAVALSILMFVAAPIAVVLESRRHDQLGGSGRR